MQKKYPVPYKQDQVYFQYQVANYERSKRFYQEVLGFEVLWDGGEKVGWTELALPVAGARIGLNLVREGRIKKGSGVLTLVVDDLDSTVRYLESKGVKASKIVDIPDMVSYFNIKDSEGNQIQIVADARVRTK
jgi:predicted enzyme related to lactoylglutathione lyase